MHTAFLPQKNLPLQERRAHIFPHLQQPLIFIGTICENQCIAVLEDKQVNVYNKYTRECVMQGVRDPKNMLYMINVHLHAVLTTPPRVTTKLQTICMRLNASRV